MRMTLLPTLCIFFLAFNALASARTHEQDHRKLPRLKARGSGISSSKNMWHIHYGPILSGITLDLVGYDDAMNPKCGKKVQKNWRCECACRCAKNGEMLCGTDVPFNKFRHRGLNLPVSQDQAMVMQAKLASACSPACSCSHLPVEYEAGPSGRRLPPIVEASSSGAGPSKKWYPEIGEASSSGAGPSRKWHPEIGEASSSGAGPSKNLHPEIEEAPISNPAYMQRRGASGNMGLRSKPRSLGS